MTVIYIYIYIYILIIIKYNTHRTKLKNEEEADDTKEALKLYARLKPRIADQQIPSGQYETSDAGSECDTDLEDDDTGQWSRNSTNACIACYTGIYMHIYCYCYCYY